MPTLKAYYITEEAEYMRRKKEEVKKVVAANFTKDYKAGVKIVRL